MARIYFLHDEFPTLGKFPLIADGLARYRGFGLKFHVFVQTLSQLKEAYGEGWNTMMGNIGCVQYFGGTSDLFTAEIISKMCGVGTEVKPGTSEPAMPGGHSNTSYSTYPRPQLTPDEVMRLKRPTQLILCTGEYLCPATLFDPSLRDFPGYLAFMAWIDAGRSPEEARIAAMGQFQIAANENRAQQSPAAKPGLWSRIFRKAG